MLDNRYQLIHLLVSTLESSSQMKRLKRGECKFILIVLSPIQLIHVINPCRLYNNFGRTYLFDLDFWYLQEKNHGRPKYCIDAYHAGNVSWAP